MEMKMSNYNVPSELRFSKTHEWVKDLGDYRYRVGISDYAAQNAGDITYVELPDKDVVLDKEASECIIETVKSSEEIVNQIEGTVVAVNNVLEDNPELVSSDCYGEGWLYEIQSDSDEDFYSLMNAEDYEKFLAEQDD